MEWAADEESETLRARSEYNPQRPTVSDLLTPAGLIPTESHSLQNTDLSWRLGFQKLGPVRDIAEFQPRLLFSEQTMGSRAKGM